MEQAFAIRRTSSGKEMICPERMEDEAVREGKKTIARVTALV